MTSFMKNKRGKKARRMAAAIASAGGLLLLAAVAGHASDAPWTELRPRFDGVHHYIRYHAGFQDGHSTSQGVYGSGHGHTGDVSAHVHDPSGAAATAPRSAVEEYLRFVASRNPDGTDHTHQEYAPPGLGFTGNNLGAGKAFYEQGSYVPVPPLGGLP